MSKQTKRYLPDKNEMLIAGAVFLQKFGGTLLLLLFAEEISGVVGFALHIYSWQLIGDFFFIDKKY